MSPIVADQGEAVSLHDERELGRGERSVLDPIRKLAVPDAVVPAQLLAGLFREVGDNVPVREIEHPRLGLGVKLRAIGVSKGRIRISDARGRVGVRAAPG